MLLNNKKLNNILLLLFKSIMTIKIILSKMDIPNTQFFIHIIFYKCKFKMELKFYNKSQDTQEKEAHISLTDLVESMIFNFPKPTI
jgi:hypothetical protein